MIAEIESPEAVAVKSIDRLESEIVRLPKANIEIVHHFSPGIYAREMRVPAGSAITGKRHKTRHLNIVSAGRLFVFNELDGTPREISAPFTFVSEPGTRRAAIVLEDVVWTTVHATEETDIAKLESLLVEAHDNPLLKNLIQPEVLK